MKQAAMKPFGAPTQVLGENVEQLHMPPPVATMPEAVARAQEYARLGVNYMAVNFQWKKAEQLEQFAREAMPRDLNRALQMDFWLRTQWRT